MACGPSAFVCGAHAARAMCLFTVFVCVSVVGKLSRFGVVDAPNARALRRARPRPPSQAAPFFYTFVV